MEVSQVVGDNSRHADLLISWYIPEIVRHERQYQMQNKAIPFLTTVYKLEKLLGHNLNITEEIVKARVNEAVEKNIKEFHLHELKLKYTNVDWKSILIQSAYRQPPFESGEKEKGFRDALIAETFCQLVKNSPVTPNVCRIAMVTGDALLTTAINKKIKGKTNVRIIKSLEDLKSLINTLVNKVEEDFILKIKEKAKHFFFNKKDNESVYYKKNIHNRIVEKFSIKLKEIPENAATRENGSWYISNPSFIKKLRQKVYWSSRISVEFNGFEYIQPTVLSSLDSNSIGKTYESLLSNDTMKFEKNDNLLYAGALIENDYNKKQLFADIINENTNSANWYMNQEKRKIISGKTVFDIIWSVTVNTQQKLINPKIEDITFVVTEFD